MSSTIEAEVRANLAGVRDAIGEEDDDVLKYRGGSAQDHARNMLAEIAGI